MTLSTFLSYYLLIGVPVIVILWTIHLIRTRRFSWFDLFLGVPLGLVFWPLYLFDWVERLVEKQLRRWNL